MFRPKHPRASDDGAPDERTRRRPPWRRPKHTRDPARSVPVLPALPSGDSVSDESFAVPPGRGPLKRFSGLFKEADGRVEENLKSMKRRVVQVRRQPDDAPVRFQLGFRSRTGWEPIRARKENQDCLVALVPWGPDSAFSLFAALDGHGRNGHQCAMFVAQRVVAFLNRFLTTEGGRQRIADTLHRAVIYAERKLESPKVTVDYQLSGSTGVFVLVHGATLYCANVGDSRAIVGREKDSRAARARNAQRSADTQKRSKRPLEQVDSCVCNYSPVQLSIDQKPSRPDEKQRLLATGARVDAWEGVDVGEERVWLPEARIPGLAVSRSFGDLIVKQYGVNCTPEVYTLDLAEDDRFLVMASDGVFEFLSNEEVTDIVGRWRERGGPQEAAEELVKQATERWIDDDSVIDDISCVVVFMNVVSPGMQSSSDPVFVETSAAGMESLSDGESAANSKAVSRTTSHGEDVKIGDRGLASASLPIFPSGLRIAERKGDHSDMMFEDNQLHDAVNGVLSAGDAAIDFAAFGASGAANGNSRIGNTLAADEEANANRKS